MSNPANDTTPNSRQPILVALNTREAHLHLLGRTYSQLAAFAWDSYRQSGERGAILLNELEINRFLAEQDKELRAKGSEAGIDAFDVLALPGNIIDENILLPALQTAGYARDIVDRLAGMLTNYQPEQEIVVVFIYGSDDISLYQLKPAPGQPPPPQASKLATSQLN